MRKDMGVFNKYHRDAPADAVFIGRPSKWGNPFVMGRDGDRAEVIRRFEEYLLNNPELLRAAKTELAGKDLVCFCWPNPCHGEVLIRHANKRFKKPGQAQANRKLKEWEAKNQVK